MRVEFEHVLRGISVRVFADGFEEDLSVGISLGPEQFWVETEDGIPIEDLDIVLTDEEEMLLMGMAIDIYLDQCRDIW